MVGRLWLKPHRLKLPQGFVGCWTSKSCVDVLDVSEKRGQICGLVYTPPFPAKLWDVGASHVSRKAPAYGRQRSPQPAAALVTSRPLFCQTKVGTALSCSWVLATSRASSRFGIGLDVRKGCQADNVSEASWTLACTQDTKEAPKLEMGP